MAEENRTRLKSSNTMSITVTNLSMIITRMSMNITQMSAWLNIFTNNKLVNMVKKQKNIESKTLTPDFKPSMTVLSRIMQTMVDKGTKGKTQLSLDANLNYARLAKHIVWLEKKGLTESTIENNKINVVLTKNGKIFASTITDISQ